MGFFIYLMISPLNVSHLPDSANRSVCLAFITAAKKNDCMAGLIISAEIESWATADRHAGIKDFDFDAQVDWKCLRVSTNYA